MLMKSHEHKLGHESAPIADEPIVVDMTQHLIPREFRQPWLRQVTLKIDAIGGVNLSQGTCQLPTPREVIEGAQEAMARESGIPNRYSPADGIRELREPLTAKLTSFNRIPCKYENVAVTTGATGALEAVGDAFLEPGDEVILFSPAYPYHRNVLERRYKATIRYVHLRAPDWTFDIDEFRRAITPKTKFVLICNPGNPTGKVFTEKELTAIGELCRRHGIFVVTDEVYEYITFDNRKHISIASLPGLFDHTITIGSYSKTFAITGWRIGYLCAPTSVFLNLRVASDQIYICPPTALQHGVAKGLTALGSDYYAEQLRKYTRKRQILCDALEESGFAVCRPQGAYYVIADTTKRFPGLTSEEVAEILIQKAHVGAVPASDFLGVDVIGDPKRSNFLRFCFAVEDDLLEKAARQLKAANLNP